MSLGIDSVRRVYGRAPAPYAASPAWFLYSGDRDMKPVVAALLVFATSGIASAHIPVVLPPIDAPPIASYFLDHSEISHAIYSELTDPGDLFVLHLEVKAGVPTVIQMLTPVCSNLPGHEAFQPGVLVLTGDLPWRRPGERSEPYLARLRRAAIVDIESHYPRGERPQFYEPFGQQSYWVGGQWRGQLPPGPYTLIVYSPERSTGTFTLGINEREAWTPMLFQYTARVLPAIRRGSCAPGGFTGRLRSGPPRSSPPGNPRNRG